MIESIRFASILVVAILEQLKYEITLSFNTTRDFIRYRLRWVVPAIVKDKLKKMAGRR
jgi:hypothetical protein